LYKGKDFIYYVETKQVNAGLCLVVVLIRKKDIKTTKKKTN